MTTHKVVSKEHRSPLWGTVCVLIGVYCVVVGTGVLATDSETDAPGWVLYLCGIVFAAGGIALWTQPKSRARLACVAVILAGMSAIGFWVSIFGASEGMSGGIPFLPREFNVLLGRGMFGLGALICALCLIPLWRSFKRAADD